MATPREVATGLSAFTGCDVGSSVPMYGMPCPEDGGCVYGPDDAGTDARVRADASVDAGPFDARADANADADAPSDASDASSDALSD